MQNKLDELYALFKLIDQDILGGVTKFKKKHYVIGEKFGKRFVELGYKNLDEVRERTSPYIIRRTKNERKNWIKVLSVLSTKIRFIISFIFKRNPLFILVNIIVPYIK